jgi:opacity protein-like surface antigen
MMEKRLRFWFVTLCLILMGQTAQIANAQAPKTIEIGPHFGASSYVGELNVWKNLKEWDWKKMNQFDYNLGVVARYNYDMRWAFRFDYTHGRVKACDTTAAWRPEAMLNFRSTVNDFSFMVEFNFLDYYTGYPTSAISPYIFAGFSVFLYDTKPFTRIPSVDEVHLRDTINFSIPFGVGCKLSLTKHLAATIEWRMHYTFTDYLDDVGGLYVHDKVHSDIDGYDLFDPSGLFHENQQRGNSQTNDWFGMINVSVTYKFLVEDPFALKRLLLKLFPFYYKDRL